MAQNGIREGERARQPQGTPQVLNHNHNILLSVSAHNLLAGVPRFNLASPGG